MTPRPRIRARGVGLSSPEMVPMDHRHPPNGPDQSIRPDPGLTFGGMVSMDQKLASLTAVVERTDTRLRSPDAEVRIWPTGFPMLDDSIGGGFRAGALN